MPEFGVPPKRIQGKTTAFLDRIFQRERSVLNRFLGGTLLSGAGFALMSFLYWKMKVYFPSVTMITVALITLYCGLRLGLVFAFVLCFLADYCPITQKRYSGAEGIEETQIPRQRYYRAKIVRFASDTAHRYKRLTGGGYL